MAKQQYVLVDGAWTPIGGPPGAGVPTGGTSGQVLAKSTNTNYDTVWITPSGGTSSFYPTRTTTTVTTGTMAVDSVSQVNFTLAAGYRLLRISTSSPCRVRVYANTTKRTADLNRAIGADLQDDHGLFLEFISTTTMLAADLSPVVDGYDNKTTPNGLIPVSVTNTGTSSAAVTITLTWIRSE